MGGGSSSGEFDVVGVRSALGKRRLALDAVRERVFAADRREVRVGPSLVERLLRVDLKDLTDLASDAMWFT